MPQLNVRDFGPIQSGREANDGWLPIRKVTVLIGDQATGKSTVAKLIATFSWLEKMLYKGDLKDSEVTRKKCLKTSAVITGCKIISGPIPGSNTGERHMLSGTAEAG